MTADNSAVDVITLQRAIQSVIQQKMTGIRACLLYPVMRQAIEAPVVLVELVSLDADTDPGTGELALLLRFEARVVVDHCQLDHSNALLQVQALAVQLALLVSGQQWGLPVMPATVIQVALDAFKPELDAYVVWVVEWQQAMRVGTSVWAKETVPMLPHAITVGVEWGSEDDGVA